MRGAPVDFVLVTQRGVDGLALIADTVVKVTFGMDGLAGDVGVEIVEVG